jgi:AraC family transcriptional regulator
VDIASMTEIKVATGRSVRLVHMQEVVGRAVALLEAADRELGQTQEAARSSIARAASILLAGIGHPAQMSSPRGGAAALLPWQSRRVLDYIEEHLGTAIRVSDLSALLRRTEAHFSRVFKQTFGVSPHAYVLRRRIERASRLMIESTTPLSEIALKCGFNDQAHLSKRFRQHTGATPAAWRREQLLQTCPFMTERAVGLEQRGLSGSG